MQLNRIAEQANQAVKFLCVVSGVRRDVLERVPGARSQAATLGFLLLLTPSLSGITMSYAIFRIFAGDFFGWPAAIGGGLLWTGIIFGIERSLLLGIDKTKGTKYLLIQVAIRVPLAFVIGITVSQPLLLRICRTVLDGELHKIERGDTKNEIDANAQREQLTEREQDVAHLESAQNVEERRARGEPDSQEYRDAKVAVERADTKHDHVLRRNAAQIARLQREIESLSSSLGGNDSEAQEKSESLRNRVLQYQREISQSATELSLAKQVLDDVKRDWRQAEANKLTAINARLNTARTVKEIASAATENRNRDTEMKLSSFMRPNLVNEYTVLSRIERNPSHPDAKTLSRFEWMLALLFFIVEVTPISVKAFSRRTPMDDAMIAAEAEDEERALNSSNLEIARLQKAAEVAREVQDRALEMWRDGWFEHLRLQGEVNTQDLQKIREEIRPVVAPAV